MRCGYCRSQGHNRKSCPTLKASAASGDSYAQSLLAATSQRLCSHCRLPGHNITKCSVKFKKDLTTGRVNNLYLQAVQESIVKHELGEGALVEASLDSSGNSFPYYLDSTEKCMFAVVGLHEKSFSSPPAYHKGILEITTLAEPSTERKYARFAKTIILPGVYQDIRDFVSNPSSDYEMINGINNNYDIASHYYDKEQEKYENDFQVLEPASEIEIKKMVNAIESYKDQIVNYSDVESWNKSVREGKRKKKLLDSGV